MEIGLNVNENCLAEYQAMMMHKKYRYIIYHNMDNKSIEIEMTGERDESFEDFVKNLPDNDARFCVFDYHIAMPDGRINDKIVYIFWCPDNAPVKVRMVSAATNLFFQNKIPAIAVALQCNDYSELEKTEIEKKIK